MFQDVSKNIDISDNSMTAWTLAWNNHCLVDKCDNLFDANIFFPAKNTLAYSEGLFSTSLLSLPFYYLTHNPILGFNFVVWISFVLNGIGMFLLARYYTKNNFAAFIASLFFTFCSYKVFNIGHLQNLTTQWMPFALLSMHKFFDTKKKKYLFGFAILFLIQGLASWYHLVFLSIIVLTVISWFIIKKKISKKLITYFILSLLAVFVFLIPFLRPYLELEQRYELKNIIPLSADLGGYLIPAPDTIIHNKLKELGVLQKKRWGENRNYIGLATLFLVFAGIIKFTKLKHKILIEFVGKNVSKMMFLLLFIGIILSFGPYLHIFDRQTNIPLPYHFIYNYFTPINFLRAVSRYSIIVMFAISILMAIGFKKITSNFSTPKKILALIIFSTIILLEHYPTKLYRITPIQLNNEALTYIKEEQDVQNILELPLAYRDEPCCATASTRYMLYSTQHWKNIFNGYSGIVTKDYAKLEKEFMNFPNDHSINTARQLGIDHVIFHPNFYLEKKWKETDKRIKRYQDNLKLEKSTTNFYLYQLK